MVVCIIAGFLRCARHGRGTSAARRRINSSGDILMRVVPSRRFANRPELETALARGTLYSKARRDTAIRVAHLKRGYTLSEIGSHLGLHYTTVSKVINQTRIAK